MAEIHSILLTEDDTDLQELIRMAGEKRGYKVSLAGNGLEAKRQLEEGRIPELIILDINMPGMDGLLFCRWLREDFPAIPVIFLSARTDEYDKILALEIGGDDYLTKPFSMKELFTRVAVSLRRVKLYRTSYDERPAGISRDGIDIRPDSWTCTYGEKPVLLTVTEFRILHKLLETPGRVFTRDTLAQAAFPEDQYNSGRSVDIHISRIRKKIQKINPDFDSVETVYQVGYKWKE